MSDCEVNLVALTVPKVPGVQTAEEFVAYAARVSNPENQMNSESAPKLMRYLIKNKHWSPFEMVHMVIEIKTTRDIGRQILRHRSFSFQEFSQRYADPTQLGFTNSEARLQDNKNRQNSIEVDDELLQIVWNSLQQEVIDAALDAYTWAADNGIAKEVRRKVLPEGLTNSTMYMSGTLRSWIHYVLERKQAGTQKEHRLIALKVLPIIQAEFPAISSILEDL
jgi:thymidylate synthase (FAD)